MFGFTIGMDDLIKLLHNQKIPKTRLFGEDMIITSGWRLLIAEVEFVHAVSAGGSVKFLPAM